MTGQYGCAVHVIRCVSDYSASVGVRNIVINLSVCASVYLSVHLCVYICLSVCPRAYFWDRWTDLHEFLCRSPVTVARSSSGGVALHYVLPVLWMTSRLAVMGRMALRDRPDRLAGLTVSYMRDGTESNVHECLVVCD